MVAECRCLRCKGPWLRYPSRPRCRAVSISSPEQGLDTLAPCVSISVPTDAPKSKSGASVVPSIMTHGPLYSGAKKRERPAAPLLPPKAGGNSPLRVPLDVPAAGRVLLCVHSADVFTFILLSGRTPNPQAPRFLPLQL